MKIINPGILPAPAVYQGICSYCGALLEAEEKELEFDDVYKPVWVHAKCIFCDKQQVTFKKKK